MWSGEKKLKDIETDRSDIRAMRRALNQVERHKSIVRAVADMAFVNGLSSEDKYTVLAYELLLQNEQLEELLMSYAMMSPRAYVIAPNGTIEPGDIQPAPVPDTTAEDALMEIWRRLHSRKFGGKPGWQVMEEALLKLGRIRKVGDRYEEVPRT